MLVHYYDSSYLLSVLLDEPSSAQALVVWNQNKLRVSSLLLRFEVNVALRRKSAQLKRGFNESKREETHRFLEDVFYRDLDQKLEASIRDRYDSLSKCRSLDAIHIATALNIRETRKENLRVCSFDKAMIRLAQEFDFMI
jgi:predicted nucleic acid-binding protein